MSLPLAECRLVESGELTRNQAITALAQGHVIKPRGLKGYVWLDPESQRVRYSMHDDLTQTAGAGVIAHDDIFTDERKTYTLFKRARVNIKFQGFDYVLKEDK